MILQLIVILLVPENLFSQQVTVSAKFDTVAIVIGKQSNLVLQAVVSKNLPVKFPALKDSLVSKVEILGTSKIDTSFQNGMLLLTQHCLVTSFDSGAYEVPPLAFTFNNNGKIDTVFTSPVTLKVFTIPVDTAKRQIYDIKEPIKTPLSFAEILPYLLWIVPTILLICLILYLVYRLKSNKPIIPVRKIIEPPHVIALRELERLKEDKLWQNNQVKTFHTRLTEILRIYIENRFEIAAMEETSDEILFELKKKNFLDNNSTGVIQGILSLADMVKFAKANPAPGENDRSLEGAFSFVNNTKIEEVIIEKKPDEAAVEV